MSKIISFNQTAQEKLVRGIDILHDAVSSTLGPQGQNVMIDNGYEVVVIHDGVKVARAIELEDAEENAGVRVLRQAANKQVQEVGDGTTAVVILGAAIIKECLKITATGVNPMSLRRGLEEGSEMLLKQLDTIAIPVKTLAQKIQVATVSAEDKRLGKIIGETVEKMGVDGVITVEESKGADTYVEYQEGMQFDGGYISPYFVTNPDRMEATSEDCFILITDQAIVNWPDLLPLLERVLKITKNLVVIAPDVTDSALASFIVNKVQGNLNVVCVKAPLFGEKQKEFLQDIAIMTGGTLISEATGQHFDTIEIKQLGRAARVTAVKDATMIVGGQGSKEEIKDRINAIQSQLDRAEGSDFEQVKLKERIAKLSGGVAVLKVGGETEVEMKERFERADDAVHATQAAVSEGIVPGGETAYFQARKILNGTDEKDLGYNILYKALERPFHILLKNAGMDAARFDTSLKGNEGVDVIDGQVKDMIKSGIIDPVRIPKSAIKNAVSVAIQIMTTNVLITNKKEEKK